MILEGPVITICFIIAWFVQMGFHEGAHAYVAQACGDPTAKELGKLTFDPFRHINWNQFNSVLFSVIFPVITAFQGLIPMGMAWVPVTPSLLRNRWRDHALVAAAGPCANIVVALFSLGVHALLPKTTNTATILALAHTLLYTIYLTSILYGLFNAVPLPPLDGSRVLYFLLPRNGRELMDDIEPYGFLILIALFWFGQGAKWMVSAIYFAMGLWYVV